MISVYIHIPYCMSKCSYCDFYSFGRRSEVPDEYINALLREIKRHNVKDAQTVYLGGGTPSLLTPKQVEKLISACSPCEGAEITVEANPDAISKGFLSGCFAAGVNRVSLGVQTASDESLLRLGRTHTAETAAKAMDMIVKAGFINISGDIMLALPGYSCEEFDKTLALLKNGGAAHISSYILKIEPRTKFGLHPPKGLPSEDEAADFYLYSVQRLEEEGYKQYEISNFAKTGFESRHNIAYWNCDNYIGIGAAAHSCMDNQRFFYPQDEKLFISEGKIVPDGECNAADYIMLRLRLNEGLYFNELKARFNACFNEKQMQFLQKCKAGGYAVLSGDNVKLTPRGMLLQNSILSQLI